ncbi:MAG: DUF763 domain-containing protein [Chitinophagaceae bacterium]|nr:DUF763 domain-containing protein [Chitinophagaceae bacterium]
MLGIEGVGPKTIRALALISEIVYGKSPSFNDPVRYSFHMEVRMGIHTQLIKRFTAVPLRY